MSTGEQGDTREPDRALAARLLRQSALADVALLALSGTRLADLQREIATRLNDVLGEGRCEVVEAPAAAVPFDGGIAAPLDGPSGSLGELRFHARRAFTDEDARFVQGMARVLGSAMARRRSELVLRRNAEGLATTLYSIGDAVIATDEEGRVTRMNPVAEQLTGWTETESIGRPLGEVFHIVNEETRHPADNPVDRVLREGVVIGLANHTALVARDGSERPIADSGAPIRGADGSVLGAVLVFRDVTEQRRQEVAAQFVAQASAVLAEDLDYETTMKRIAKLAVPDLADWCGVDLPQDGKLVSVAVEHKDPARIELARRLRDKYPPELDAPTGAPNVLRTGRAELYRDIPDELLVAASHGDEERLRASRALGLRSAIIVPLPARGRVLGTLTLVYAESGRRYDAADLALAEDIGRRAGLALDNALLYKEAMQAINVRDDFMSVAGHELKTPLGAALLQLQLLTRTTKDGVDPARLVERAEKAIKNLSRLGVLINELLDVSRITAGRLVLVREDVDLAALVGEVLGRHGDQLARAGCEVELTSAPALVGSWDRTRVEQVFGNLLTNAIKYGQGKPIHVAVSRANGAARLIVRDRGIGIAPEDQARVFERFERAVSSQKFGGLGLGLWISRQIVEAHGGSIRVHSAPGEGATFEVELPLRAPPGAEGAT